MITQRELDILNIIATSEKPLIASEMVKIGNELLSANEKPLTINTVQAVLKRLLRNKVIEVAEIVYSGTVLSRTYKLSDCASDILTDMLVEHYKNYEKFVSKDKFILALKR